MKPDANSALIFELGDALLKSWWTLVAAACFGVAGAVLALNYIPKVYQATTKVRVVPQAIPTHLVESTVTDRMASRLSEVREAILGRDYMIKIIEQHFGHPQDRLAEDSAIRLLRSNIRVDTVRGTDMFLLSYLDNDAARAAEVANTLTRLYVEQNLDYRTGEAETTQNMFDERAETARVEYQRIEEEFTRFNLTNRNQSEVYLDSNLQQVNNLRRDIEAGQLAQRVVDQRIQDLLLQVEQGVWSVAVVDGVVVDPTVQRVVQLRRELEQLKINYSESHPDVLRKQRELDDLLALGTSGVPPKPGAPPRIDPNLAVLQSRISAARQELDDLKATEHRMRGEIGRIQSRIDGTARIQTQLNELEERRKASKARYDDLKAKAEVARNAVLLEQSERGERLDVLEWALAPIRPVSPDPLRVYLLGVAIGCLLFVGPLLARRFLNPIIASEAGLKALVDLPVLVSIPRVATQDNSSVVTRRFMTNLGFSVVATAVLLAVLVLLG